MQEDITLPQEPQLKLADSFLPPNQILFYAKQEEVIKLSEGKFYFKGELVEDKYQVYERFHEWLKMVEETK